MRSHASGEVLVKLKMLTFASETSRIALWNSRIACLATMRSNIREGLARTNA